MVNLPGLNGGTLHRIEPFEYRKSESGRVRQKRLPNLEDDLAHSDRDVG